jgi:protein-tyrosine-phosphatase
MPGGVMSEQSSEFSAERNLEREVRRLADEFQGIWSRETIARFLSECHTELEQRGRGRVVNFLPLMAGRFARDRLWALAQAEGLVEKTHPEALFVCVRNAGRSQIAAALTHHLSNGWIGVRSAGSLPGEEVQPTVVRVMEEIGVDIHTEFPKPLTDEVVRAADVVVTMGCGDACPVYPGKRYEDWQVADPADQPIEVVRQIRDDIKLRVEALVAQLTPVVTGG